MNRRGSNQRRRKKNCPRNLSPNQNPSPGCGGHPASPRSDWTSSRQLPGLGQAGSATPEHLLRVCPRCPPSPGRSPVPHAGRAVPSLASCAGVLPLARVDRRSGLLAWHSSLCPRTPLPHALIGWAAVAEVVVRGTRLGRPSAATPQPRAGWAVPASRRMNEESRYLQRLPEVGGTGLEPVTPSLSSWCSPN